MDKNQQQAILARDMIDMIREYPDDADALEYINSFSFSLARIFEGDSLISWDEIASVCDQRYYSLRQDDPVPLDINALNKLYESALRHIEKNKLPPSIQQTNGK